ncbi:LytR/AlgR family response regulator transcription factor [Peptostreptococcus canis]|uniref:Stage 0 sporulation protein A homolog n=1 Tax=Peptostreptococcus canis TaxID=1159213 RepID=A0ABR6TLU9_9FIRM|nr:response regulator [Peptostreptococcus canis]MBC2575966.1 response regulator [Peptostreptococcus canis]MBP1997912.1 DNA-binding LytR/AlgR family response regulator [Peptostreptococcus canis]
MNIAIVEDNKYEANILKKILDKFSIKNLIQINYKHFDSGEKFLEDISKNNYQIVFMDIYMNEMDGIETSEQIIKDNYKPLIIYFTSSYEDIWRAVKTHNCFDYIIKDDITYEKIEKLLLDSLLQIKKQNITLKFSVGKQKIQIKISTIQYIISNDKNIIIVLKNGFELKYRITFISIYESLKIYSNFILINRGVLLNMDFVKYADSNVFITDNKNTFSVRRKDRMSILKKYNDYQFEKLMKMEE